MRQGMLGLFALVALASVSGASGASVPPVSGLAVRSIQGSLVISSLSGDDKRALTKPRGTGERRKDYLPTWSPDGSQVAFARWTPNQLSLMVVKSDGSGLRRVATLSRRQRLYEDSLAAISWSPDASQLAYDAYTPVGKSSTEAIYVAAADGSSVRQIALRPKNAYAFFSLFGWTPDGRRVTYALSGGEPLSLDYEGPSDLMTTSADGTDTTKLLRAGDIDWAFWLADGSLLYVRNCLLPSACQLVLRTPSGSSRPLTHFRIPDWVGCCQWDGLDLVQRPTKGEIVYEHSRKVYDFSPTTNMTRTVHVFRCPRKRCQPLDDDVSLAGVSRDGRVALVEYSNYGGNGDYMRDYRLDLETGAVTRIHLVTTDPDQIYLS